MLLHPLLQQLFRYLGIGGLAFLVDFGLLVGLKEGLGLHAVVAATLSFLVGLVVNYLLCLLWVFQERTHEDRRREFFWFAAVGVAGVALNALIIAGGTSLLGLHYTLAKLVSAALVVLFNFFTRRHLLFSTSSRWNARRIEALFRRTPIKRDPPHA